MVAASRCCLRLGQRHVTLRREVYDFDAVESKMKEIKYLFRRTECRRMAMLSTSCSRKTRALRRDLNCNEFSDFVSGPPPDPAAAKCLADGYNEGIDLTGASVAAVAALAFFQGQMKSGSEE